MTDAAQVGEPTVATPGRVRRAARLLWRFAVLELRLYGSLLRWVTRRPDIPVGAAGFGYDARTRLLLVVFIVVSAVEVVALDLILHRWPAVRLPLLVVGIWGVVWMLGLLATHLVRPHTVGPHGARVRDGMDLDLDLPWDVVHAVGRRTQTHDEKPPRIIEEEGGRVLVVAVSNETNLQVTLEQPMVLPLPGLPGVRGEAVTKVRFWADDPRAYLDEVRRHL